MADQERPRSLSFKEQILRDLSKSKQKRQEMLSQVQRAHAEKMAQAQVVEQEAGVEQSRVKSSEARPAAPATPQAGKIKQTDVNPEAPVVAPKLAAALKRKGKSIQVPLSIGKKHTTTIETEALRKQRTVPAAKEKAHAEAVQQKQPGSQIRMKAAPGKSLSFAAEEQKQSLAPVTETKLARVEQVDWQGEDDMEKRQEKRRKQNQVAKKIVGVVTLLLLLCFLATGVFGYIYVQSALGPIDQDSTEYVQVEVPIV